MEIIMYKKNNILYPSKEFEEVFKKYKNDNYYSVKITKKRNLTHHRKFFALLRLFVENNRLDLRNIDEALYFIKIACGYYKKIKVKTKELIIPESISFENMEQGEFEMFYNKAVNLICIHLGISREEIDGQINDIID